MQAVEINLRDGMLFEGVGQDGVAVALDSDAGHGGRGLGHRPMELMLTTLGSCTAMDVISILRKMRQQVTGYRVEAHGEQAKSHPYVFTHISLRHIITGIDVREESVKRAIELSEQTYCPAYAMLSKAVPISTSYEIVQAPAD